MFQFLNQLITINYNYHEFSEVTNDLSILKLKNCLSPEGDKQTFSAEGLTRICHFRKFMIKTAFELEVCVLLILWYIISSILIHRSSGS